MKHDYDLFVIGAGSGGVRAARIASLAGAKVAIAEEYRIGGTCVIRGCVPKKFLVYGAEFAQMLADAPGYGWTVGNATLRLAHAARQRAEGSRAAVRHLHQQPRQGGGHRIRRARRGRRCAHGAARASPAASSPPRRILIATGGRTLSTRGAAGPGARHHLERSLPARQTSASACSSSAAAMWRSSSPISSTGSASKVRIVHRGDKLLRGFDDDLRAHLHIELRTRRHRSSR